MFLAWKADPKQRSSSVWIDRSGEYGTSLDPWSKVYYTDEGILQSMAIKEEPWRSFHHRSLLIEDTPNDLCHPSVFDFMSNTVNTVDSE